MNYNGQFYKLQDSSLRLKPVQKPYPPIWIAGRGSRMLKITALQANGWIGSGPPYPYKEPLRQIRHVAKGAGRDPIKIVPACLAFTSIASDHETAQERWPYSWAAPILGTPDECIDAIEKLVNNGARHFILGVCAPTEEDYIESLNLYARKVVPYFRELEG